MSDNIYGGPFPWANLFGGVSGLGGGMSEEDIAWQAYLDYSGLSQAGVSGDDYLGSFLPEIDTSALPPEVAAEISQIAEITPDYGTEAIPDDYIDYGQIAGITPDYLTASASTSGPQIEVGGFDQTPSGDPYKDIAYDVWDLLSTATMNLLNAGKNLTEDALRTELVTRMGMDPNDADALIEQANMKEGLDDDLQEGSDQVDDEEDDTLPIIIGQDQVGGGISGIDPDDIVNAGNTDEAFGIDDEAGGDGIRDMLPEALKGMYDKLGIGGILSILGLLGFGGSKGSSASQGGIGSFASSQFDPSGLGATADYANMPGGGVGQPTWLPNTNAPIYYPFASEVTKQYNAQQGGPFSFTAGPPPEAMIQNLTPQRIPGVTYVADGAFMRRNGLTQGPGTETSDDIPAMLSDGEFVTNAEANRGIGAMALLNQGMPIEEAMDPEQQRLAGARQMYLQQAMGQQLAKQMRNR